MLCKQSPGGFELGSPCPFSTRGTITPQAPPKSINVQDFLKSNYKIVMALEEVTKRTEHHGYSIGIYITRTKDGYKNIGR